MAGAHYDGGGIMRTVEATRAASIDDLRRRTDATAVAELRRGRRDDRRDQVRLRAHRRGRGARRSRSRASSATRSPGSARTWCLPSTRRDRDGYVALVAGRRCSTSCAPLAQVGRRLLRPGRLQRRRGARSARRARARRGLALRAARQPARPQRRRGARRRARLRERRPLHVSRGRATSTCSRASATVATLLPGAEFSTRSAYPSARRLLDARRDGRARDRLQPGLVVRDEHGLRHRARGARDAA